MLIILSEVLKIASRIMIAESVRSIIKGIIDDDDADDDD